MPNARTSLRRAAATLKECRHVMRELTHLTWWTAAPVVTVWLLVDATLTGNVAHLLEILVTLRPS